MRGQHIVARDVLDVHQRGQVQLGLELGWSMGCADAREAAGFRFDQQNAVRFTVRQAERADTDKTQ